MKKTFYTIFILFQLAGTNVMAQVHQDWNTPYATQNDTFEILVFKADQYGNTYAGGYEGKNMFLQKINSQGSIEWTISDNKMIDSIPNGAYWNKPIDFAKVADLTFDSTGNIFVVISKAYQQSSWFGCVLKLSGNADSLSFFHVYSSSLAGWGANVRLVLPKIALLNDKKQVLIYTAIWDPAVGNHHTVFLFDSGGTLKKHQVLPGSQNASSEIFLNDVVKSDTGFYLYATSLFSSPDPYRTVMVKIDDSLQVQWYTIEGSVYGTPSSRENRAVRLFILDTSIYAIATMNDSLNPYSPNGVYCYQYNLEGVRDTVFKYNRNYYSTDKVSDALLANENIYLAIRSFDSLSSKAILLSLNSNLDTVWIREFGNNITGKVLIGHTLCQDNLYLSYTDSTAMGNAFHLVQFNSMGDVLFDTVTLVSGYPGHNGLVSSKTGIRLTYHPALPVDTVNYLLWYDQEQVKEPVSFTAPLVTARSIHLSWILGAGNADSLVIYRKTEGQGNFSLLDIVAPQSGTYVDSFLNPDESYTYSLRVRSGQNYSCDSLFLAAKTLLNTRIRDAILSGSQIILYPNPTQGTIIIKMSENQPLESVEVYDSRGRLVLRQTSQTIHLDTMPSGVYLVRINKLSHHKVIKQ